MEKETLPEEAQQARFYKLMDQCNVSSSPNPKAREALRRMIKFNKHAHEILLEQIRVYDQLLQYRIEHFKGTDLFKEFMLFQCQQLRTSLGYESASALERLAIEQIMLTYVNYLQVEQCHADVLSKSPTMERALYWEKRLSFACNRHSNAIKTLARIRRLNLTVQVNVAQNQVVRNG